MDLDLAAAYAQVIATLLLVATIYVYWRQAKTMEEQLRITKEQVQELQETRSRQQLYEVISSLFGVMDEIELILDIKSDNVSLWSDEERKSAGIVCNRFHLLGIMFIEGLVPEKLFSQAWYYSIPECYKKLNPYLKFMRKHRGQIYWSGFDELNRRVIENTKGFEGFVENANSSNKCN